jgi:hypothetical protein
MTARIRAVHQTRRRLFSFLKRADAFGTQLWIFLAED